MIRSDGNGSHVKDFSQLTDLFVSLPISNDSGQDFEFELLLTSNLGTFRLKKNGGKFEFDNLTDCTKNGSSDLKGWEPLG